MGYLFFVLLEVVLVVFGLLLMVGFGVFVGILGLGVVFISGVCLGIGLGVGVFIFLGIRILGVDLLSLVVGVGVCDFVLGFG